MDVQRGHCWRCEKVLPKHLVRCDDCPMAEYCTTSCRHRDKVRHSFLECQIFRPKTCSNCGTKGNAKECAQCNYAWYCNKECQRRHWATHKHVCNEVLSSIKSMANKLHEVHSTMKCEVHTFASFPYYIGNVIVRDFLQLDNNEWSGGVMEEVEVTRDYHVLSVGCGDLRNTVLTAASLPARYQGKLHFTLNDFDPFVMARNVMFLYMLVRFADTEDIESSLSTVWYSLHISKREYDLIKTSLDELIQMNAQSLHDVTKGLVSVLDADLMVMSQVWAKWRSLECQQGKRASINLRQQRKALFDKEERLIKAIKQNFTTFSPIDEQLMNEWFDNGLFLPTEPEETELPFDNPTLTGRNALPGYNFWHMDDVQMKDPKHHTFVYCIKTDSYPFTVWDSLRVRESTFRPHSSPMVMYHNYVTNLLQKMKSLILQGRLYVRISLANCLDFLNHHQSLQMPNFDRIFTSNIADYVGFAKLLQTFKPLLNSSNSYSAIVTMTMRWFHYIPEADIRQNRAEFKKLQSHVLRANYLAKQTDEYSDIMDHHNNSIYFLAFLRGHIMGGGLGIQPLKDVPSLNTVMTYHGLRMRDFRKERNRLVPFQYRVQVRELNCMTGLDRAVEWYLPHTDK